MTGRTWCGAHRAVRTVAPFLAAPRRRHVAVLVRRILGGCLMGVAAGCAAAPTDPATAFDERWRMSGEQRTPVPSRFDGELVWTARSGDRLDGQVDLLVQDASGVVVRRAGLATGRVSGTTVEFDVQLASGTARYAGTRRADTVTGTWLDDGTRGNGVLAAGSFRLERRR